MLKVVSVLARSVRSAFSCITSQRIESAFARIICFDDGISLDLVAFCRHIFTSFYQIV